MTIADDFKTLCHINDVPASDLVACDADEDAFLTTLFTRSGEFHSDVQARLDYEDSMLRGIREFKSAPYMIA